MEYNNYCELEEYLVRADMAEDTHAAALEQAQEWIQHGTSYDEEVYDDIWEDHA